MSNSPEIHPYLIQQKEAHDRELVRQGSNPLSPYVLHQFTPETMVHNFLMEIGSYVTIKDWHSQFCKSPNFMNVRVGIIQVVKNNQYFFHVLVIKIIPCTICFPDRILSTSPEESNRHPRMAESFAKCREANRIAVILYGRQLGCKKMTLMYSVFMIVD